MTFGLLLGKMDLTPNLNKSIPKKENKFEFVVSALVGVGSIEEPNRLKLLANIRLG